MFKKQLLVLFKITAMSICDYELYQDAKFGHLKVLKGKGPWKLKIMFF